MEICGGDGVGDAMKIEGGLFFAELRLSSRMPLASGLFEVSGRLRVTFTHALAAFVKQSSTVPRCVLGQRPF